MRGAERDLPQGVRHRDPPSAYRQTFSNRRTASSSLYLSQHSLNRSTMSWHGRTDAPSGGVPPDTRQADLAERAWGNY